MSLSFLRNIDMNKVPFNMFQVTHYDKGLKKYDNQVGSKMGGCYTVCASTMIIGYFMYLGAHMISADQDNITLKNLVIDLDDSHDSDEFEKYR